MRFGISTHLYHDRRLERAHLAQIAGAGFETIELFATRSHFDYRDGAAVADLSRWLTETGLTLNSVHAPITDVFGGPGPRTTYSNAVGANDAERPLFAKPKQRWESHGRFRSTSWSCTSVRRPG